ncbi:MAG: universal stress protein [Actinobacteria bacterium]|nr:universal stress protein [Actinomycetota bacterium]MCG2799754.1 universal stress protein [Cellulomonas sp.]
MSIVVGFLATIEGRAALDEAIAQARQHGDPLFVVVSLRAGATPELEAETVAALASTVGLAGIEHEVRVLRGGDVADDILGVAEEVEARLVVLGLRRRSRVGKLILGANAQRVLFDAPCPVLTVKPGAT